MGRPCATLILKKGNIRGSLHCVNDDVFESFFEGLKTNQKPIFDTFWRCEITKNAIQSDRKTFQNILKSSKTDLKNIETGRNRFLTFWKRSKTMQKQVKTVKNDAKTAEIQFKTRQDTSEGADFLYTY